MVSSRTVHPYKDLSVIDAWAPRTNQAVIGSLTLVAFVFNLSWLVGLLALQLLAGLTLGRRFCLPCLAYFELIQPRLGEGPIEDARPPRFANMIGLAFLGVATLSFVVGWSTFAWVLTLIVSVLALLAAVSGICLGCELYARVAKLRGVELQRQSP
jgi:Domain of unknown function (DUF4395)